MQILLLLHLLVHLHLYLLMCYFHNLQYSFSDNFNSLMHFWDHVSYSWYMARFFNSEYHCYRIASEQEKKDRLTWLLNNRASDCWKILPTTIEESCKRIQKHKMDVWYNVNIASAIDFQIICYYVQSQFLKVLPSVLMKTGTGWGVPEALLTQPLFLQLFNMLKMPLQEI